MMKKIVSLVFALLISVLTYAQNEAGVEMADALRSSGKIYVVVASILVIFLGIVIYLVSLDRKISKIEKEHK